MVFHYLLTQKSTSLSRGAWPPQPPQWQLPWWRTLFVGTQVPLGVRLPSALPEDDKRICKKIDLKKWGGKHFVNNIIPHKLILNCSTEQKTTECSMQSVHSWPVMSCENFEQGVDVGLTYLHSLHMRLIVDILLLILLRTRSWSLTKGHRGRLLFRWETCLWTWGLAVQMNACKIGILSFGKFSKCDHKTSQESECEAGVSWRTSNHPEHIKRPNPNTKKDIIRPICKENSWTSTCYHHKPSSLSTSSSSSSSDRHRFHQHHPRFHQHRRHRRGPAPPRLCHHCHHGWRLPWTWSAWM